MYFMEKQEWELILSGLPKARDVLFRALRLTGGDARDLSLVKAFEVYSTRCVALQMYVLIGTDIPLTEKMAIAVHHGVMSDVKEACRLQWPKEARNELLIDYYYHLGSDAYIHPNLYLADKIFMGMGDKYPAGEVLEKASDAELRSVVECIRVFAKHGVLLDSHRELVSLIDEYRPHLFQRMLSSLN